MVVLDGSWSSHSICRGVTEFQGACLLVLVYTSVMLSGSQTSVSELCTARDLTCESDS